MRKKALNAVVAAALSLGAREASANSITVNTTNMTETADNFCGLAEAVKAINNHASYLGCQYLDNGPTDGINIPAGTYTTSTEMTVTRDVIIQGAGATTIIDTGGVWGFAVRGGAGLNPTLWLTRLTLRRRASQSLPVMGVFVDGSLETVHLDMQNVRVTNFNSGGVVVQGAGHGGPFVTINRSTIDNGSSVGLSNSGGTVGVTISTISNNNGGGILNDGSSGFLTQMTISDSMIQNNGTSGSGGGILNTPDTIASIQIGRSLISGNQAAGDGGGLYNLGQADCTNALFTGNSAAHGGGIAHAGGFSNITHCTFTTNSATLQGGGIYVGSGGAPVPRFSLLANNTAPSGPDYFGPIHGATEGSFYNFVKNSSGATAVINGTAAFSSVDVLGQDPKLGRLVNLGLTLQMPLLAGSPAIDRIPTSVDSTEFDQGSNVRPQNGTDEAGRGNALDCGAYESPPAINRSGVATATASSQSGSSRTPALAKDRNTATRWEASNNSAGTWLQMSWSTPFQVSMVTLREFNTRITGYRVEYLTGSTWTSVASGTSIGAFQTLLFAPVTTTAIRLFVTSATGQPSITEFEIYGE